MLRTCMVVLAASTALADMPTIFLDGDYRQQPRIIGGEDANEGEFPYMVAMRQTNDTPPGYRCGGSVLTSNWVLTTAICCKAIKLDKWYAYAGSIYLSKGGSSHKIQEVFMHEKYAPNMRWRNDICVIKLAEPFTLGKQIAQVTLGPTGWPVNSNDKVTVTGWGRKKPVRNVDPLHRSLMPMSSPFPDRLQKGVDFIAMTNDECYCATGVQMFDGYLCARGKTREQGTWRCDTGSPLVKQGVQVGVVSFGFRPFGTGLPTVYTRTTHYLDWIKEKLGPDASQLKIYKD